MIHDDIKKAVLNVTPNPHLSNHYKVPVDVYYDNLPDGITPEIVDKIKVYDEDYIHSLAAGAQELFADNIHRRGESDVRWGVDAMMPVGEVSIYTDNYSSGDMAIWAAGINVRQGIPPEVKEIIDQIDEMMNSL